jgi:predicted dehydrogenase
MHFALLGNHPDGLEMACCLAETGRHQLGAYTSSSLTPIIAKRCGTEAKIVTDLEEILADPAIEAVIVASGPGHRASHLRRALQSERHVLCVHPPDASADLAYEAAMIQNDTGCVLFPLLYEGLHPGIGRLAALIKDNTVRLGKTKLIRLQVHSTQAQLLAGGVKEHHLSLSGWQTLRQLGGEIGEVGAFAAAEELSAEEPLVVSGRFEPGALFEISLMPFQPSSSCRTAVYGDQGEIDLTFPLGQPGPGYITWQDQTGQPYEEAWPIWDPWPSLVEIFEREVKAFEMKKGGLAKPVEPKALSRDTLTSRIPTWQDCIRSLELDDAARRSVERRRYSTLEYPEANEEVGFKGTMTLAGCGLIWILLLIVILSAWLPALGWVIVPVLAVFLGLQLFRWIIPKTDRPPSSPTSSDSNRND